MRTFIQREPPTHSYATALISVQFASIRPVCRRKPLLVILWQELKIKASMGFIHVSSSWSSDLEDSVHSGTFGSGSLKEYNWKNPHKNSKQGKARWTLLFSPADDARRGSVSASAIFRSPWLLGFQHTFRMQQRRASPLVSASSLTEGCRWGLSKEHALFTTASLSTFYVQMLAVKR